MNIDKLKNILTLNGSGEVMRDGVVIKSILTDRKYCPLLVGGERIDLHRVMWMLHNDKDIPEGMVVDHIDNDQCNNHISNLQVITIANNLLKDVIYKLPTMYRGAYRLAVGFAGAKLSLGRFHTEEEYWQAHSKYVSVLGHNTKGRAYAIELSKSGDKDGAKEFAKFLFSL